ncbi:MAG: hypothetical protein ACYS8W_10290 [Planctomycetota bacterium]
MFRKLFLTALLVMLACIQVMADGEGGKKKKSGLTLKLSVNKKTVNADKGDKLEFTVKWENTGTKKLTLTRKRNGHPFLFFRIKGELDTCIGYGIPDPETLNSTPVEMEGGESLSDTWKAEAFKRMYIIDGDMKCKWTYSMGDDSHILGFGGGKYEFTAVTMLDDGTEIKSNTIKLEVKGGEEQAMTKEDLEEEARKWKK